MTFWDSVGGQVSLCVLFMVLLHVNCAFIHKQGFCDLDSNDTPSRYSRQTKACRSSMYLQLSANLGLKFYHQRLITSVSPSYGRILIYVWAIEQDSLSKRAIPVSEDGGNTQGRDVFVPWKTSEAVYDRYYHMFAKGELASLVLSAAQELGLSTDDTGTAGIRIVQDGWERSNYYVEIRRWTKNPLKDEC
jgi:hypothetical protein